MRSVWYLLLKQADILRVERGTYCSLPQATWSPKHESTTELMHVSEEAGHDHVMQF